MCIQGHGLSHCKRFKASINPVHTARGIQQPPPSLLHFYVYDSFRANYTTNNMALLQSTAECYLQWQLSTFAIYHERHRRDVCQMLCCQFVE